MTLAQAHVTQICTEIHLMLNLSLLDFLQNRRLGIVQAFQILPNTSISKTCGSKSLAILPQCPDLLVLLGDRKLCEVGHSSCAPICNSAHATLLSQAVMSLGIFLFGSDICACADQHPEQLLLLHHNSVIDLCCQLNTSKIYLSNE